jgi:hypothetical protein
MTIGTLAAVVLFLACFAAAKRDERVRGEGE